MNTSDKRRFGGISRLFGPKAFEILNHSHVVVVGVGGVGSWVAETLARTAVGHITLIDGDTVEESNTPVMRLLIALIPCQLKLFWWQKLLKKHVLCSLAAERVAKSMPRGLVLPTLLMQKATRLLLLCALGLEKSMDSRK